MAKLTKAECEALDYAEKWKQELWDALDYVETNATAGSLDGLYGISSILFSKLAARCPRLDLSGIPKLYEAFKNYRRHELNGKELFVMAGAVVMVVNAGVDQIINENREVRVEEDSAADAYVPAADLWRSRFTTYKRAKTFLDKHPVEIRTRSPRENRLEVHAADWSRFFSGFDESTFAMFDDK